MGHLATSAIVIMLALINFPCAAQSKASPYYKINETDPKTGDKVDLYSFLERNIIRAKNNKCSTNWQIFYFRVNSKGKIDSLRHEGTLEKMVIDEVKKNIYSTNGHWLIPKSAKSNEKFWFIYPYFDFGTHFYLHSDCPESEKNLQKNLLELSEQFNRISTMNNGKSPYILRPFRIGGSFDIE